MELINATSQNLTGALDVKLRNFSFSIPVNTFEGFNSLLQKTHFNDDYLETDVYPRATFKGKIIEEVDLSVPGEYRIRSKGKLNIHGVDYDRIIRCDVKVASGSISVEAKFTIFLDDYNIKIPSIVNQKISEEIVVKINFELLAQS
jgi:polyisoprenoid-binding protein YceI